VKELRLDGVTSKSWVTQSGRWREGKPIDKSLIYKVLNNRVYLGEIKHKEQWYKGEHSPIIDKPLWDQVQAILETNWRKRANAIRGKVPFLLKGLVFGSDGWAMSPYHTKNRYGRRYRYYQPQRDAKEHAGASGLPRLPAADLESAVMEQIRAILRAPQMVEEAARRAVRLDPTLDEAQVTIAMMRMDEIWEQLFSDEQARIVKLLVEKVIVSPNDIEVRLRPNGIERLALEFGQTTGEALA